MDPLRSRDYQRLFGLAAEVVRVLPHGAAWDMVVGQLREVVEAEVAGLMEVRAGAGVVGDRMWPAPSGERPRWDAATVAAHPLVRHYLTHADPEPRTVTEVAGPQGWAGTEVYERAAVTLGGATQQVAVPLPGAPGVFRSLTLGRGGAPFSRHEVAFLRAARPLLSALDGCRPAPAWLGLTRRELAVLTLLAEGITARAIARRLDISTGTVSKHQQSIYRKLGVADRLSAVLHARDRGALPSNRPGLPLEWR